MQVEMLVATSDLALEAAEKLVRVEPGMQAELEDLAVRSCVDMLVEQVCCYCCILHFSPIYFQTRSVKSGLGRTQPDTVEHFRNSTPTPNGTTYVIAQKAHAPV